MAVNFPNSPNQNDTHTVSGVTYKWDGTSWLAQGVTGLYTLPTASDTTLGGVKVGRNLDISTSVLSVSEPLAFDQTVARLMTSGTPFRSDRQRLPWVRYYRNQIDLSPPHAYSYGYGLRIFDCFL